MSHSIEKVSSIRKFGSNQYSILIILSSANAECGEGWATYRSAQWCYYSLRDRYKFDGAKKECETIKPGGRLAEIRSKDAFIAVIQAIQKNSDALGLLTSF